MRTHIIQMTSVDHIETNVQAIEDLCSQIPVNTSDMGLICLPENALYMRINEGEPISGLELSDPCFKRLKLISTNLNAAIHVGSSPIKKNGKLTNASILILPSGQIEVSYEKLHLFDIQLEGDVSIRESDVFQHGILPKTFELNNWIFGQSICYDLRFSELYSFYARIPVDAILVPSSFLVKTGFAHWHVLLRARAIESQSYILAAAQAGEHKPYRSSGAGLRHTFGHSLIIDPWGTIIAEASKLDPGIITAELDRSYLQSVRNQIPMRHHRRWHL